MYSLEVLIGTGVGALVVGFFIGYLLGKRSTEGAEQARQLETRLDEVTQEKNAFERRVSEHFVQTAEKLNSLTENYRGIHDHLAEGVRTLCGGNAGITVQRLGDPAGNAEIPEGMLNIEQPRDYAPKGSPDDPGMLNESFGLEKDDRPPKASSDRTTEAEDAEVSAADEAEKR